MNKEKLFWVVAVENKEKEIFETLKEARKYADKYDNYTIRTDEVRNWYFEKDLGRYNYDDLEDTFSNEPLEIKVIK